MVICAPRPSLVLHVNVNRTRQLDGIALVDVMPANSASRTLFLRGRRNGVTSPCKVESHVVLTLVRSKNIYNKRTNLTLSRSRSLFLSTSAQPSLPPTKSIRKITRTVEEEQQKNTYRNVELCMPLGMRSPPPSPLYFDGSTRCLRGQRSFARVHPIT